MAPGIDVNTDSSLAHAAPGIGLLWTEDSFKAERDR